MQSSSASAQESSHSVRLLCLLSLLVFLLRLAAGMLGRLGRHVRAGNLHGITDLPRTPEDCGSALVLIV